MADRDEILIKAIQIAGGPVSLSRKLGTISPQGVCNWRRLPVHHVIDVERITGISRDRLRPDIYAPRPRRVRQSAHVQ